MIPSLVATPCSTDVEDRPATDHALQCDTAPWFPLEQDNQATKTIEIDGEITKPGGGIEPPKDSQNVLATPRSTNPKNRPAAEHALQSNTAPWVPAKQGSLATKAIAIDGEVTKPGGGIEPPTQDSQNVRMDPSNGDGEVTRPGGGIEPPTGEK